MSRYSDIRFPAYTCIRGFPASHAACFPVHRPIWSKSCDNLLVIAAWYHHHPAPVRWTSADNILLGRESFVPYPYPALFLLQSFLTGRPLFSGSLKWSLPLSFIIQGYSIAPWDTIFLNGYFLYSQHGKPQKLDDFPKSQNNTATISDEKGCCVTQFISFGFSETLVMIGDLHSCPSRTSQLLFGIIATILFRMKAGSFGTKCGDTKR